MDRIVKFCPLFRRERRSFVFGPNSNRLEEHLDEVFAEDNVEKQERQKEQDYECVRLYDVLSQLRVKNECGHDDFLVLGGIVIEFAGHHHLDLAVFEFSRGWFYISAGSLTATT